jgi:membrane-associated phospholipid phosphatase
MRPSEWIQSGFATLLAIAAWVYPIALRRRLTITLLAACAVVAVALARVSEHVLAPVQASILRDWLPVPLMLIPYWQTGQFFKGPNEKIQARLQATDRWLFDLASRIGWTFGGFARLTLEWAYMLCYPLVPLGLATLYAAGLRRYANTFWFFVLVPTYLCYAITPFVPALPPRSIGSAHTHPASMKSRVLRSSRVFNLWILKHGSIQAISFPSAHVASALAVSLVLLHYVPLAGIVFLVIAFWIAVAAVVGGQHYVIDVVLGAAIALAFDMAWRAHLIPSTAFTAPAIALVALL